MAETIITLARTGAAVIDEAFPSNHSNFSNGTLVTNVPAVQRILLAQFEELASTYRHVKLVKATLGGGAEALGQSATVAVSQAGNADMSTVTWETQPLIDSVKIGYDFVSRLSSKKFSFPYPLPKGINPTSAEAVNPVAYTAKEASEAARKLLEAETLAIWTWRTSETEQTSVAYMEGTSSITTPSGYTPFNLYVMLDPDVTIQNTVTANDDAPRFGYMSPYEAHTFSWDFVSSDDTYSCAAGWDQASATFYYRNGTSGNWTTASLSSEKEITLQSSVFDIGSFQWYVVATDDDGRTTTSPTYTLSTTDSDAVATPLEPIGTVEDGSAPITFKWSVAIDTGMTTTGADLQKSTDGTNWTTFEQYRVAGSTEYSAPAGAFSAGITYWRVRAFNADGVPGNWSSSVQFVCVAAPDAPVVSCDAKPFATVSWQSSGQQVYEVTADGKVYGPYFGTAKSFTLPDFLTDGQHQISVRIQGIYGLWSAPGSVTFSVTNIPGDGITLTGKFGRDAALSWTTDAVSGDYIVYRDDVRIARTGSVSFTDRLVLGQHRYYVINKIAGGYYTKSNTVSGTMRSCTRAIAAAAGGAWLEMALSADSDGVEDFTWSEVVRELHVSGSDYPVVETSPYRDASGTYSISFSDVETARAFEALQGQTVIVKSRGGNVMVGVLSGYSKTMTHFYITFVFTVRACSWEDFVDETGD